MATAIETTLRGLLGSGPGDAVPPSRTGRVEHVPHQRRATRRVEGQKLVGFRIPKAKGQRVSAILTLLQGAPRPVEGGSIHAQAHRLQVGVLSSPWNSSQAVTAKREVYLARWQRLDHIGDHGAVGLRPFLFHERGLTSQGQLWPAPPMGGALQLERREAAAKPKVVTTAPETGFTLRTFPHPANHGLLPSTTWARWPRSRSVGMSYIRSPASRTPRGTLST